MFTKVQESRSISPSRETHLGTCWQCLDVLEFWTRGREEVRTWPLVFLQCCSLLTDIRPTMKDLSVGGYSDPKEHQWGVWGKSQRGRSLGFLRVGVWERHVARTSTNPRRNSNPKLTASKKGPVHMPPGMSSDNINKHGSGFFPSHTSRWECSLASQHWFQP